jgi:hypothetical protein
MVEAPMTVSDPNDYIIQLEAKLERIDRETQRWHDWARKSGSREQRLQIALLRDQIDRLRFDLSRASTRTYAVWSGQKTHLDRAWREIKIAYHSTVRTLQ